MSHSAGSLHSYLGKFLSAVVGFSRVSGSAFILGCASLAVSRVCQVVAFFLPLKIFIIIYSKEVPEYFDFFPDGMGFREAIVLLSSMVPIIYALFILFGIVYRWLVDLHLRRFGKAELVIGGSVTPEKKMKKLHNHLSKAFSEAGLAATSILFAAVLSPQVALVWFVLIYTNLWLFHAKAFKAEDHDRLTFLKLHRRQFIEYISSANFLVVFAVLALELVYFDMGVYTAIFLLLVSRMVFQALNRFSVESLYILKFLP